MNNNKKKIFKVYILELGPERPTDTWQEEEVEGE
jgi:hypothetical protein